MSTVVCLNLVRVALTTLRNMEAEKYSHPLYTYYMHCVMYGVRWPNSVMGSGILQVAAGCSALIKASPRLAVYLFLFILLFDGLYSMVYIIITWHLSELTNRWRHLFSIYEQGAVPKFFFKMLVTANKNDVFMATNDVAMATIERPFWMVLPIFLKIYYYVLEYRSKTAVDPLTRPRYHLTTPSYL